jgi:hypothetical protein
VISFRDIICGTQFPVSFSAVGRAYFCRAVLLLLHSIRERALQELALLSNVKAAP